MTRDLLRRSCRRAHVPRRSWSSLTSGDVRRRRSENIMHICNKTEFQRMKGKKPVAIVLAICLLSLNAIAATDGAAAVLWIEDFEDGNYDGWMIEEGTFDASSRYLEATSSGWNDIFNTSRVSCGYWGYDLFEDSITGIDIHVFIIALGYQIGNLSGYSVSLEYGLISNLTLYRWDEGVSHILDHDTVPLVELEWINYNITRDSEGFFQVVRISEVLLSATDNTYTDSQFFLFYAENGGSIDNITIMECGWTPPPNIGLIVLAGLGTAVAIIVVIVIIWWRRRAL